MGHGLVAYLYCLPLSPSRVAFLGTLFVSQGSAGWTGTDTRSKSSQPTGWPVTTQELGQITSPQTRTMGQPDALRKLLTNMKILGCIAVDSEAEGNTQEKQ